MPLRRLGSLNSAAQVRPEAGEKLRLQLEAAFSLLGASVFCLQSLSGLDEAHPHYGG